MNREASPPSHSAESPVIVYDSQPELAKGWRLLREIFSDLWSGRELATRLFWRNLKSLYRQTLLGIFWIFLPPLANTAIWVFLRSRQVFDFEPTSAAPGGTPLDATLVILTGMVLWQSFSEALQMPLNAVNTHRTMLGRLKFPREALLLDGLFDLLFHLVIRLTLLIPALVYFQVPWQVSMLWGLPVILSLVLWGIALGLWLVPVGSLYHDVNRFLATALPFWMIITPIIYELPREYPGTLLNWLNPASPLIVAGRDLLLLGQTTEMGAMAVNLALVLPILLGGLVLYRLAIPALVERMVVS